MGKPISLEKILFSQGFGTRRYCNDLVYAELVHVNGQLVTDPDLTIQLSLTYNFFSFTYSILQA